MMQKVQGLVFAVFCLWFSLLFHLSLAVQLASIAPGSSFLSPILGQFIMFWLRGGGKFFMLRVRVCRARGGASQGDLVC